MVKKFQKKIIIISKILHQNLGAHTAVDGQHLLSRNARNRLQLFQRVVVGLAAQGGVAQTEAGDLCGIFLDFL